MLPHPVLVLGGANSGKSAFAECVAYSLSKSRLYLATARPDDDEMRQRISMHMLRRGTGWKTVEAPLDVVSVLSGLGPGQVCLLDCLTMWLSNHLLDGSDLETETERLVAALRACPASVILVSNEVGQGIVPDNRLARRFREAQGRLNIRVAAESETVVQVVAGLPIVLKGQLP